MTGDVPPALEVVALRKEYGRAVAVADVSFETGESEFLTLLGPSGSGKTTTLRIVAGFASATAGTIRLRGEDVTSLPPERRDIGMVFQSYALFPHLSAARNIAFPLEMRRVPRDEIRRRVGEALELVRLEGYGDRLPRQLSGGQQQRVAVARAVVARPRLLLMDEPLGALDRKLREALQVEILRIRRELGIAVVYVTHDQDEALSMSDRIAVFNQGAIEQIGSARELYERPATRFVAAFLGEATIIAGCLADDGRSLQPAGATAVPVTEAGPLAPGARGALVIRSDRARLRAAPLAGEAGVPVRIEEVLYLGADSKTVARLPDGSTGVVRQDARSAEPVPGETAWMCWAPGDAVIVADPASITNGGAAVTKEYP